MTDLIELSNNKHLFTRDGGGMMTYIFGSAKLRTGAIYSIIRLLPDVMHRIFIDPLIQENEIEDVQEMLNIDTHNKFDLQDLDTMLSYIRRYPKNNTLLILNNCFTKESNLSSDIITYLFKNACRLNIILVVGLQKMNLPHRFYSYCDMIFVLNPIKYDIPIAQHFGITIDLESIQIKKPYLLIDVNASDETHRHYVGDCKEFKNTLYTIENVALNSFSSDQNACCICLESYNIGEHVVTCQRCNNNLHHMCLIEWFNVSSGCPLCRTHIKLTRVIELI